jgi:hypothetical protein
MLLWGLTFVGALDCSEAFQPSKSSRQPPRTASSTPDNPFHRSSDPRSLTIPFARSALDNDAEVSRRRYFRITSTIASAVLGASLGLHPTSATAGVDVTGLPVQAAGDAGASLQSQLKFYESSNSGKANTVSRVGSTGTTEVGDPQVARYALRSTPGLTPRVSKQFGVTGPFQTIQDAVLAPVSSSGSSSGNKYYDVPIRYSLPADWLQLDRLAGGIQYVDQRNGDKLYILQATLPPDTSLTTVPKAWFGTALFDPQGAVVKTAGNVVEDYKITSSNTMAAQVVSCTSSTTGGACTKERRRLGVKYATVTGNGLRVERRGLIDAYQVDNDVYMLLTSTNANKFQAGGPERDTAEAMADSFRVER